MLVRLKDRARALKAEVVAIYFAAKDPRTPWYAKALVFFVVAHTLSPIDLIPDFIPVLGFLDDLVITPAGLWLAVRLIPPEVLAEARVAAAPHSVDRRPGTVGMLVTLLLWLVAAGAAVFLILYFAKRI
ncbi:MAG TPA: YkvA family protein [Anaerolineales bacterium]|nr:YkvA family protein [Anaerolineales bacterium]